MSRTSIIRQAHSAMTKADSTPARKRKGLSIGRTVLHTPNTPTARSYGFLGGVPVLRLSAPPKEMTQVRKGLSPILEADKGGAKR